MLDFEISELNRRLANLLRLGTVAEVNHEEAKVRVAIGDLLTDWLPWMTTRAGGDNTWWAPDEGEQVLVLAPSGDLTQAVVMASLYQDAHPPQENTGDVHSITYQDGTKISYNRETHELQAILTEEGSARIEAQGGVTVIAENNGVEITGDTTITGDVSITGNVSITGELTTTGQISSNTDVVTGSVSLKTHTHTGDSGGTTSPPL